jgi:hypothetical protein
MFPLHWQEVSALRSQFVTLDKGPESRRGRHAKYLPHAFTERRPHRHRGGGSASSLRTEPAGSFLLVGA